jgi:hypothetical protein
MGKGLRRAALLAALVAGCALWKEPARPDPEPVPDTPEVAPAPPSEPEPSPEPEPKPEPVTKPEPAPKPKPVAKPEPAPKPEPAAKPEPAPKPEPAAKPEPAPAVEDPALPGKLATGPIPPDTFARPPPPLQQKLSVNYSRQPLHRVLASLSASTGVDIVPGTAPGRPASPPVTLRARSVPLTTLLDRVARLTDRRYEILSPTRVLFGREAEWLDAAPLTWRVYRVRDLYDADGRKAFLALLDRAMAPLKKRKVAYRIVPRPNSRQVLALLPASGHRRLDRVLSALRGRQPAPEAVVPEPATRKALAATVPFAIPERDVLEALALLADAGGLNLGVDPRDLAPDRRRVKLAAGGTVEDALKRFVEATGLAGYRVEPHKSAWLYGRRSADRLYGTMRCLWTTAEVRTYYARGVAEKLAPASLAEAVRARVAYDAFSGRLLVIHDRAVQQDVRAWLKSQGMVERETPVVEE